VSGVTCNRKATIHPGGNIDKDPQYNLSIAANLCRQLMACGNPRPYSDTSQRQISACAKVLLERILGEHWIKLVETRMLMKEPRINKWGKEKQTTPIYRSDIDTLENVFRNTWHKRSKNELWEYLPDNPPSEKSLVIIDVSPGLLTASIEGPWGRYKNGTLTLKNLPVSVGDGLVGRSLAEIVAGLPDDPVFARTIATNTKTSLAGDGHRNIVSFEEETVPLYTGNEKLKAA